MTITGTKMFIDGTAATAADANQYLMRGVKVFETTTSRDSAYNGLNEPTLEEGEVCYIKNLDSLQFFNGLVWQSVASATGGLNTSSEGAIMTMTVGV